MKKSKNYDKKYFSCSHRERDNDKAEGSLLEIAKKFEILTMTVGEILTPHCWPGLTESRFMQEGVRTNGYLERSGSLSKLFNECSDYLSRLDEAEKDIKERRVIAKKMLDLLHDYQICSECNGECGELLGPNYFVDCDKCDGQGMTNKI